MKFIFAQENVADEKSGILTLQVNHETWKSDQIPYT